MSLELLRRIISVRLSILIPDSQPADVCKSLLAAAGTTSLEPAERWRLWTGLPTNQLTVRRRFKASDDRLDLIASHSLNRGALRFILRFSNSGGRGTLIRGWPGDPVSIVFILVVAVCGWTLWLNPGQDTVWLMLTLAPASLLSYFAVVMNFRNEVRDWVLSLYPDCECGPANRGR